MNVSTFGGGILETLQTAAVSGTGTPILVDSYRRIAFTITGPFTGSVKFQATINDTDWFDLAVHDVSQTNQNTDLVTISGAGMFVLPENLGLSQIQADVISVSGGAITVQSRKFHV